MIDQALAGELKSFRDHWDKYLAVSPFYALDGSWPSIGIIDQLTFPLRQKKDLTDFDRKVIRGAAAYLAVIGERCWVELGAEVVAEIQDSEVVLRATAGPKLGEAGAVAYVERDLLHLLEELPAPLPLFSNFRRMIPLQENFVSPFAFALFTGLLPSIEGPWTRESPQSWGTNISAVVRHLAQTTADRYALLFPDEQLGQVAELYYSELIFPLTMMTEELPARRSVHSLLEFAQEYKVSNAALSKLSENLMRMSDERIAFTGFACAAALAEPPLSSRLRAHAISIGASIGLLRAAMLDVRTRLLGAKDWIEKTEFDDADRTQIEKEFRLRMFPWLKMGRSKLLSTAEDEEVRKLVKALGDYNMRTATVVLDQLIELAPDDMEFRLQRVYLELLNGELPRAEASLKSLLTEPLAEDFPLIFDLMGNIQLLKRDFAAAELHLKKAHNLPVDDPQMAGEIENNYGWMLMLKGDFDTALERIDESLTKWPDAVVTLLNRTTVLHQLQRFEEAAQTDRKIIDLAPFHREVFRGLVFDPGSQE